jgi:hypothetical protein
MFENLVWTSKPLVNKRLDDYGVFTQVIWSVNIESADFNNAFYDELYKDENYKPWDYPRHKRAHYVRGKSQIIDQLIYNLENKYRDTILTDVTSIDNRSFNYHWKEPLEYYIKNCKFHTSIFRDQIGFEMSPHRDNHEIMGQYVINLTDNEGMGTEFFEFNTHISTFKATGKKFEGIGFLNTALSAHTIQTVTKPRYILYISVLQPLV